MTKRRFAVALLALLAVPAVWSWWSSDRRRIGRQVDELQELVSKSGPETALSGLATARAVTALFASSFEVRAQQLGFSTRDRQELTRFIHGYRSAADSIRMQVTGSSLSISTEHRRATLNAAFEFPTGGPLGSADERYRVQVNWLEEDGRWLIDYVDLVEIVGRSGGFLTEARRSRPTRRRSFTAAARSLAASRRSPGAAARRLLRTSPRPRPPLCYAGRGSPLARRP